MFTGGKWWTRSQRIRTAARLPFQVEIIETKGPPIYQQIAEKALHLHKLGLTGSRIAKLIGVTDKTVGRAIVWGRRTDIKP